MEAHHLGFINEVYIQFNGGGSWKHLGEFPDKVDLVEMEHHFEVFLGIVIIVEWRWRLVSSQSICKTWLLIILDWITH